MKYWLKLVFRVLLAFLIKPEFFYFSLLFLTMAFPYLFLKFLSYNVEFIFASKTLIVNGIEFEFVKACIATSAYYLLALLILTTKDIDLKKSIKMFLLGGLLIFVMNVLRVTLLIIVVKNFGINWFEAIHLTFWYVVSSVYVFLIWIFLIRFYKIKNIPVYTDIAYLINIISGKK